MLIKVIRGTNVIFMNRVGTYFEADFHRVLANLYLCLPENEKENKLD